MNNLNDNCINNVKKFIIINNLKQRFCNDNITIIILSKLQKFMIKMFKQEKINLGYNS